MRTRKEKKKDQECHYNELTNHCEATAKEIFKKPVYMTRKELEDEEQEKYLAEWNRRLKKRKEERHGKKNE